jgi:hypothetical protein
MLSAGEKATDVGLLKSALVPTPSAQPAVLPAKVLTAPLAATTRRMRWLL